MSMEPVPISSLVYTVLAFSAKVLEEWSHRAIANLPRCVLFVTRPLRRSSHGNPSNDKYLLISRPKFDWVCFLTSKVPGPFQKT
jgi:hypothetical protein